MLIMGKEITYVLRYAEARSKGDGLSQWSFRQIGVYQRYSASSHQSVWFLIFPMRDTPTERDLVHKLDGSCGDQPLSDHPLSIHVFLLSTRMNNWRLCISQFEKEVWKLVDPVFPVFCRSNN